MQPDPGELAFKVIDSSFWLEQSGHKLLGEEIDGASRRGEGTVITLLACGNLCPRCDHGKKCDGDHQ